MALVEVKKGFDIKIKGASMGFVDKTSSGSVYGIVIDDFWPLTPILKVSEGDVVKSGQPVISFKERPSVKVSSPISGTISKIIRGKRRNIEFIEVKPDLKNQKIHFEKAKSPEALKKLLLDSGCWSFIRQRPYNIIANPELNPKSFFISSFRTEPLAADLDFTLKKNQIFLQEGIKVLKEVFNIPIYFGIDRYVDGFLRYLEGVINIEISGPHPAGDISVLINKIDPINKGELVWTIEPENLVTIGRLKLEGIYLPKKTISLTGSPLKKPIYCEVISGVLIKDIIDETFDHDVRIISGNFLTGRKVDLLTGFLGFYHYQVSVVEENKSYRILGYLPFLSANKIPAISRASLYFLFYKKREHSFTTALNGEQRSMVLTGEMEKVFPMDIYPMQMLKAILANDIEKMEELGIYEVIPEDFSLIDYISSSKIEAQQIVKKGIEMIIKEENI